MKRVFGITNHFRVPDGTLVAPFLNSNDSESGLPFGLVGGFSIAAGILEPGTQSQIHVLPLVSQVTFVLRGSLKVVMQPAAGGPHYTQELKTHQAVLTEPNTPLQLINGSNQACEVLYIASPAFLFELSAGKVLYDDAVTLGSDWSELERPGWRQARRFPTPADRASSEQRLRTRSAST